VNPAAYLARIGFDRPTPATFATLRALHVAHLESVPFENLDIHLGRIIALDETILFEKVVEHRRGGFCYELNGLFAWLLRTLGYRVTLLSAGVARESGGFGPEFDHLLLRVDLDEPWLADVGFGECFREPIRLDGDRSAEWHVDEAGGVRTLFRAAKPQYRFTLTPHALTDFAERCRFHQTSPDSHFTRERLTTLARPDGRVTLSGTKLIRTIGETRSVEAIDEEQWETTLEREFGLRAGRYWEDRTASARL
jgi:N-hydroxyarylamine O-acetyltransferase